MKSLTACYLKTITSARSLGRLDLKYGALLGPALVILERITLADSYQDSHDQMARYDTLLVWYFTYKF